MKLDKQTAIRLPQDMIDDLDCLAKEKSKQMNMQITRSDVIRMLLIKAIKQEK